MIGSEGSESIESWQASRMPGRQRNMQEGVSPSTMYGHRKIYSDIAKVAKINTSDTVEGD